jgi:DNA processing protein
LYVRGTLAEADRWAVAVVGTRQASTYGKDATHNIVTDLAAAGVTIVSGLALGTDAVAHSAALQAGGRTLAVLGSGVDQVYPLHNRQLGLGIINQGAVISEYPPGTMPTPTNFPPHNRLISGLSLGVLVIEAAPRSGALITADFALEQGCDVFSVPGNIFSLRSGGRSGVVAAGGTRAASHRRDPAPKPDPHARGVRNDVASEIEGLGAANAGHAIRAGARRNSSVHNGIIIDIV